MEEWRPIPGFPMYDVSNRGRVRSHRRRERVWRNPRSNMRDEPVVLRGSICQRGYVWHCLRKEVGEKPVRIAAHRLVASAFLGDKPSSLHTDVAHNDGDPGNNVVENLRWATHRDNSMDMRAHGTMQDGERCVTAKLSSADVSFIRWFVSTSGRGAQKRMSELFGISRSQVNRIVRGKRWAAS